MAAKNENEILSHMTATFKKRGRLSGKVPGWTPKKTAAIQKAIYDGLENGIFYAEDLGRFGALDIGVGEQMVYEGLPQIHDGSLAYRAIEGSHEIYDAAVARTAKWPGYTEMIHATFDEFVHTDLDLPTPCIVTALDVIYHIVEEDLYHDFMERIFTLGAPYVVLSYPLRIDKAPASAQKVGDSGFGWHPRPFIKPEGWEEIYRDPHTHTTHQAVAVFRNPEV